jgi:HSP20 family molecular chaperone IbpA
MHRISLDMSGFKPEDVNVSLKNRQVIIDAKMEEKSDDGHHRMYQEVTRQYTLPENVQVEKLRSLLSDDGVLSIEAPIAAKDGHPGPIEIPIQCDSKGGKGQ